MEHVSLNPLCLCYKGTPFQQQVYRGPQNHTSFKQDSAVLFQIISSKYYLLHNAYTPIIYTINLVHCFCNGALIQALLSVSL